MDRMCLRTHAVRRAMTECPNAGKNNTAKINKEGLKIWRREPFSRSSSSLYATEVCVQAMHKGAVWSSVLMD
uniref:Uncharacterized protein n=1 Tax=Trichuris muris TaxID=70415 RepID=A0A5S6R4A3_TRIMR